MDIEFIFAIPADSLVKVVPLKSLYRLDYIYMLLIKYFVPISVANGVHWRLHDRHQTPQSYHPSPSFPSWLIWNLGVISIGSINRVKTLRKCSYVHLVMYALPPFPSHSLLFLRSRSVAYFGHRCFWFRGSVFPFRKSLAGWRAVCVRLEHQDEIRGFGDYCLNFHKFYNLLC